MDNSKLNDEFRDIMDDMVFNSMTEHLNTIPLLEPVQKEIVNDNEKFLCPDCGHVHGNER